MSPYRIPIRPSNLAEMDTGEVIKDLLCQSSLNDLILPSLYNRFAYARWTDTGVVTMDQLFQEPKSSSLMLRLENPRRRIQVYVIREEVLVPKADKRTSKGASVTKECRTDTGEVLEDQWFLKRNPCFLPTSLSKKEPIREIEKYLENPTGRQSPDWDQPNNVTLTEKYERNSTGRWSPAWNQRGKIYVANRTGRHSPDWDRPYMSNGKMMQDKGERFSGNKFLAKGSFKRMKYDTWQQLVLEESLGLCDTSQPEEELMRAIRKCMIMREMLQHQAWINEVP